MTYVVNGLPRTFAQEETQTEEHAPEEEHNPILPEINELIWGSIAFLIVLIGLWKFAFPAINKMLATRTEKIRGDLEQAEQTKAEADQVLGEYRSQLNDARSEANRIIDEARKTAESMRKDLLARAEEESRQIVARAQDEIRAERDRAFQELRSSIGELSVELAGRVVGETLTKDRHMKLVDGYIDEVAKEKRGS